MHNPTKIFNTKFKQYQFKQDLEQSDIIRNYYSKTFFLIETNFSSIQIPIHIFDGKLSIV